MVTNLPVVVDNLTLYLSEIRKFKLLTEDEERNYAIKFFEEKDLAAAHTLITSNLRFVVKVASEYRHYGLNMLDLIQEGNIGLMMAVRKFNPYKGVRLISYAVWWIRAYIQNFIVSAWSLVKIGTTQAQKKLFYGLHKTQEALRKLTGSDSDTLEVSRKLQVPDHEVVEMEQRLKGEVSINNELFESDGLTILDTIADSRMNQEDLLGEYQQEQVLRNTVTHAMQELNEKERYVVEHRIMADNPATLQDIGDRFSISRERVRQIEERTLTKLRNILKPQLLLSYQPGG
jgi:RNA polymerase sigma-32 factor